MVLLTWCGIGGAGWVVTACVAAAVLWERTAPSTTVVESDIDDALLVHKDPQGARPESTGPGSDGRPCPRS